MIGMILPEGLRVQNVTHTSIKKSLSDGHFREICRKNGWDRNSIQGQGAFQNQSSFWANTVSTLRVAKLKELEYKKPDIRMQRVAEAR